MGCCQGQPNYEFDRLLTEFWNTHQITSMTSNDYINLILSKNKTLASKNLNSQSLKENFYKELFAIEKSNKFHFSTIRLIDRHLDFSVDQQYSILLSLMFFTKNEKFLDLYNNLKILFVHLSTPVFFGKGFEDMNEFNDKVFKKILINFYKIASLYTYEVIDKRSDPELVKNQDFVKKSFSVYMIEDKLISSMKLEDNYDNLTNYFITYPHYLRQKDVRLALYAQYEEIEKANSKWF